MDSELHKKLSQEIYVGKAEHMKIADLLDEILAELTEDLSYGSMTIDTLYDAVRLYHDQPWKDDEGE